MPVVKSAVYRLAADQHLCRGLLVLAGCAGFRGIEQIYLPGDDGDDHDDGPEAAGPGQKLKGSCHGNRTG